ncbi:MAG: TonB family protein [Catalinimonas sp.]
MSDLLAYLLEAGLCLAVGWGLYRLLFHGRPHFSFNRFFLLGVTALAVVVPSLHVPWPTLAPTGTTTLVAEVGQRVQTLPALVVDGGGGGGSTLPWATVLLAVYVAGAAVLTVLLLRRLYGLWYLRRLPGEVADGYRLVRLPDAGPTFTFLNCIYQYEEPPLPEAERRAMLNHEVAHVRGRHSLDLLWSNVLKVAFWFNPVVYYLERDLRAQHEYLADRAAVGQAPADVYERLLARQALLRSGFSLSHAFSNVHPQSRIHMLNQKTIRPSRRRAALSLAVLLSLTVYVACEQPDTEAIVAESETEQALDALNSLYAKYGMDGASLTTSKRKDEDGNTIMEVLPTKMEQFTDADRRRAYKLAAALAEEYSEAAERKLSDVNVTTASDGEGEIFLVVEEPARPVGGIKAFYRYVGQNLGYPDEARAQGIEGRVFVQFVIERDGTITNVETVKSPHPALSAEAERVMLESAAWMPGKQRGEPVRVRMVIPLIFKLHAAASTSSE